MDQSLDPFSATVIIRHPLKTAQNGIVELDFSVTLFTRQFDIVSD
jgi:hypothetical protein